MTIQISIVGLGQIGTSVGLALSDQGDVFKRVGHDLEPGIARRCKKIGAIDLIENNLHSAVENANIILLSLPTDQVRETMSLISSDLMEDAVVMDTCPIKVQVAKWADELLPDNIHYVGLIPVLNPAYLHETDNGIDAAHTDLFHGGLFAIVAGPKTTPDAIKLATDFTRLLGAAPFFVDPAETDGLMAATHLLPRMLSAALLNATTDQPGWQEGRKFAGRAYAEVTRPIHLGDSQTLRNEALLNRENMVRVINSTIAALQTLSNDIENEDADALDKHLELAQHGRETWWALRQAGDLTGVGAQTSISELQQSSVIRRWFGLGRKPKSKKQDL